MTAALASRDQLPTVLAQGIRSLGLELPADAPARLMAFLALLEKWNATYNLTAVRDPRDMLVVHLLDSLSILPLLDTLEPATLLDVGSGAGLPAIPLAICRPGWTVHSVDAVAKKISFQRQAKAATQLTNLTPHHARVEALTLPAAPDLIVCRAYSAIDSMLDSVAHLLGSRTTVVAMKGNTPTDELARLPEGWAVSTIRPLDVPFLGAQRCAVVLRRS